MQGSVEISDFIAGFKCIISTCWVFYFEATFLRWGLFEDSNLKANLYSFSLIPWTMDQSINFLNFIIQQWSLYGESLISASIRDLIFAFWYRFKMEASQIATVKYTLISSNIDIWVNGIIKMRGSKERFKLSVNLFVEIYSQAYFWI